MVEQVTLYRVPTTAADADAIGEWLAARVDAEVTVRDRFLSLFADDDQIGRASCRERVSSPV